MVSDLVTISGSPKLLTQLGHEQCPHCSHWHPSVESVDMCGLFKAGWRFVDADGYLCNGPYTRPDGDGLPKKPTRLVKRACRTCKFSGVSQAGALVCFALEETPVPILEALEHCRSERSLWVPRAPRPPLDLRQPELF